MNIISLGKSIKFPIPYICDFFENKTWTFHYLQKKFPIFGISYHDTYLLIQLGQKICKQGKWFVNWNE